MDRRAFLHAGALTGLAATAAPGSATPAAPLPRPGPVDDMDAYLARIDAGRARIARTRAFADLPGSGAAREEAETLARSAIDAMFMTGMFGDLPREQQQHAGMQERMWAALPDIDDALDRMTDYITTRGADELAHARVALATPGAVDAIADALDREAEATGVSAWRRQQLRATVNLAAWRLVHQPPELMIAEYAAKIEKVNASDIAAEARNRHIAARVGEQVFWVRAGEGGVVDASQVTRGPRTTRERRIARGAKAMGIGILIFLGGAALVSLGDNATNESGGLIGVGLITGTIGVIWFTVGFLILLVGLATPSGTGRPAAAPAARPN